MFCDCDDWKTLEDNKSTLFLWKPPYGWVLHWKELTKERGYTKIHRYGISVNYCPMCGRKVDNKEVL